MLERLSLRLRILLIFAALAAASLAAIWLGLYVGYRRTSAPEALPAILTGGLIAGFAILGLVTWIWFLFDENVARAIERVAGGMRVRAHSDGDSDIDQRAARYLGDLAPAAAAVSGSLSETRNALAEAVQRETTRLATEKARLEALLSDVPVGVLLCSANHQLVFYNGQATDLLGAAQAPGLDRSLFDFLHASPIRHAHERLLATGDSDAASDLICTSVEGGRLLAARMRLAADNPDHPGYVLTLRDVTADLAVHAAREGLLAETLDRVRRGAANLRTLIDARGDEDADPLSAALRDEAGRLAATVTALAERHDAGRAGAWPLGPTRADDLAEALKARMEADGITLAIVSEGPDLILRADGFLIVGLLSALARGMLRPLASTGFTVSIREDGAGAMLRLGWTGTSAGIGAIEAALAEPVLDGMPEMTGHRVIDIHGSELWPERGADGTQALCLPVREARLATRRPAPIERRVVYDFDLLSRERGDRLADLPLDRLTYVVFDTETTGLLPSQGDEIVQIAAVRLVNGRRVAGEVFDTLVNPGRPVPPRSTDVHGITDAMVASAPPIAEVGRMFHRFAEGSVLVAHNAPFDMEFLRRHEAEIGQVFDHAILDTVLLSAVVFGQSEAHSLDALTERLGITIPEEARHTAIGDTVATADAFLKLVQLLKGRGIVTFGDVLDEVRKHGRLLKDLNT